VIEKYVYQKSQSNQDEETYIWCIYQVIGLLIKSPSALKQTAQDVKNGLVGWKSSTYESVAKRIEELDDYLVKPFEIAEGVVECGKCHSKKTWSVQRQTRSSDEPMTTFSRCVECGNQWVYNG